ncbi:MULTISPECIES: RNA polymerase sigma factor [unclassified Crossiella]|uniref:RNA polymerase sigma factor n=1 Tax=unclassified Crossiella TaxID=2620835 RepID=UPI001FFFFCE1|nr:MULTISPECIES: sigma-70 family RNA polymerase sigma factor [unclassified Crossiella]MCK2236876.1 sigma-70 family RNA polymerase sigma factor [Crossiella sp. S99.2]MCK2250544.1 sigma-70 family RNA polymerase sigma factor [Crossiella sp. S99.1]
MNEPEQRFTALYQLHYEDIARYVRRRAPELDCRDTAAEVFLTAWRRFAELERSPLPLPWLYGVARRVLANTFRGAQRANALVERVAAHAGPGQAPDHAEQTETRLAVARLFDQLPEPDREAVRLIAWEGLTSREAAAVLGCNPAALAMRLLRLRRRLRARHIELIPALPGTGGIR